MWLNLLFVLFAWFVGALALGILAGKSMALGNRPGCCPDDLQEEFDGSAARTSRDLSKLQEIHSVGSETLLHDLQSAKR